VLAAGLGRYRPAHVSVAPKGPLTPAHPARQLGQQPHPTLKRQNAADPRPAQQHGTKGSVQDKGTRVGRYVWPNEMRIVAFNQNLSYIKYRYILIEMTRIPSGVVGGMTQELLVRDRNLL
jgi:hypothetical protein